MVAALHRLDKPLIFSVAFSSSFLPSRRSRSLERTALEGAVPVKEMQPSSRAAEPSGDRKRPPDSPTLQREAAGQVKRLRRHSRDQVFSQIAIDGHARAHLGDHHVYVSGDYYGHAGCGPGELKDKATQLIEWLQFPRQDARRDQIEPAYRETFGWMYDRTPSQRGIKVNFAEWLSSGSGLYWIYGKAGSGKSTLMKLLSEESRTVDLLSEWSGGDPVILSSFYFWNTGTTMEKSTAGLLRSLLCDVLKSRPDLAEVVYSDWQAKFGTYEPTASQAMAAFRRAMQVLDTRVCFVVDGLDEYEGDEIKKADLAELMTWLARHANVKVVVSSRPLRIFESTFSAWPCLAVHDLTRRDIETMVAGKLRSNAQVRQLIKIEPAAAQDLIWEIGFRSSGVFLWAVWAVKIILDGALYKDSVQDLRGRLDELPPELEELFDTLLNRIPRQFKKEGIRYLVLAVYGHFHGLLFTDNDMALAADVEATSEAFWKDETPAPDYMGRKIDRFRGRLYSATQGLLEPEGNRVDFMHTSVAEFLLDNNSKRLKAALEAQRDSAFDPGVALMVARAMYSRWSVGTVHEEEDDNEHDDEQRDDHKDLESLVYNDLEMLKYTLGIFFDLVELVEESSRAPQTAIVDKLHQGLAANPRWNSACERYFLNQSVLSGTVGGEERLRSERSRLLEKYPLCIADAILGSSLMVPQCSVVRLLLQYDILDPVARYEVRTDGRGLTGVTGSYTGLRSKIGEPYEMWFPWEMALSRLMEYSAPEPSTLLPYSAAIRTSSHILELLIEASSDVVGSSQVPAAIVRRYATGDHDQTISGMLCSFQAAFQAALCPFCRWKTAQSLPLMDCKCEGAKDFRQEIQATLNTLADRERAQQELG